MDNIENAPEIVQQYAVSDVYFNEPETRIKITNMETGEAVIYYLNQKKEIEKHIYSGLPKKDIHAIGILQGIELTKTPLTAQKNLVKQILETIDIHSE